MDNLVPLESLVQALADVASVVVPPDRSGVAMAATAAWLRRRPRGLHLICAPIGGLQADLLIGAGAVARLETSAVTLGEAGAAPRFVEAIKRGAFEMRDATCPALLAGLTAGQKGVPFMPIRGLIGSDLMQVRPDWRVIANPFADDDPIVVVPAITPDVALFHAPEADAEGNVRIGRQTELMAMAQASRACLVTVERIVEGSFFDDEATTAGVVPALYVSAIALAPRGAWPLSLPGEYAADDGEIARYAAAARSDRGFAAYLETFGERAQVAA
jgi:glutaconate CoA-transferase subunit A